MDSASLMELTSSARVSDCHLGRPCFQLCMTSCFTKQHLNTCDRLKKKKWILAAEFTVISIGYSFNWRGQQLISLIFYIALDVKIKMFRQPSDLFALLANH